MISLWKITFNVEKQYNEFYIAYQNVFNKVELKIIKLKQIKTEDILKLNVDTNGDFGRINNLLKCV